MLGQQYLEMQRRHKEEQQLQTWLEEAAVICHIEHTAQKIKKIVKAKVREKAKKQRLVDKEEKIKWLEYLKQLQDKVLAKNTTLWGGTKTSQVVGSKYKEIISEDKKGQ